ncbi:RDD family protein [Nocardioides nanhaiensis]|uniref:RDD family protein n=1 Tax=Nocardioides nanhaiensis TaxID=1476871 RepID=A0ABP8WLK3_9ACTN
MSDQQPPFPPEQPHPGQPGQPPFGQPGPGYGGMPPTPGAGAPAGLLERFVARFLDGLILGVAYFVVSLVIGAILPFGRFLSTGELFIYNLVLVPLSVALSLGYYAYLESTQGRTLGKQVMKLQVVGPAGGHPTLEQALRRNAFLALSLAGIVPIIGQLLGALAGLAAVIFIAVTINNDTVRRQGWHDTFAGGTQVLKVG